jgi:mannose-6-phosphate isomerase-like protein (cupin superfamily)
MSIPRVSEPLGRPAPYVLPALTGESITLPGTKSVIRVFASAKETAGLLSVFSMDGVTGDAPGFHYHEQAHDIFMCTRGRLQVWAGDQCRVLSPGDFCSVPPGVVHQPRLLDPWNETRGLVTPGAWLDFFRFVGEAYEGVMTDEFDDRSFFQRLQPKFGEIREKYDVVFQPGYVGAEPSDWSEKDQVIPETTQAYYLRANTGPRHLLGGVLSRPFITPKQCDGKFAITSIESSAKYSEQSVLSKPFALEKVHQVWCVLDGSIEVIIGENGEPNRVEAGETAFIPAGQTIKLKFATNYVRFWSYSSGDGLESFISRAGGAYEGVIIPEKPREVDLEKVKEAAQQIDMTISI